MQVLSENVVAMCEKAGIVFPMPFPLFDNAPNVEHLQTWAQSQVTPMLRRIASKIADNLHHVTFQDFLKELQCTIDDFNFRIGDEPYILLIGAQLSAINDGCSDAWVSGLALEHCHLKPPAAIITLDDCNHFLPTNTIKNILLLDDAAYSGAQKSRLMNTLDYSFNIEHEIDASLVQKLKEVSFYFGIPFLTKVSLELLRNKTQNLFGFVHFLKHQMMPVVTEYLSEDEWRYAEKLKLITICNQYSITYFDHKYADAVSSCQAIYNGVSLLTYQKLDLMRFVGYTIDEIDKIFTGLGPGYTIPIIIPPYRLHQAKYRQELISHLVDVKVGKLKPGVVTTPEINALLREFYDPSRLYQVPAFEKPILTLHAQNGFDTAVLAGKWKSTKYVQPQASALVNHAMWYKKTSSKCAFVGLGVVILAGMFEESKLIPLPFHQVLTLCITFIAMSALFFNYNQQTCPFAEQLTADALLNENDYRL